MSTERQQPYQRVDSSRISPAAPSDSSTSPGGPATAGTGETAPPLAVRWWIIPLSVLLCTAQAVGTVLATNFSGMLLTPTLISVIAFGTLFLLVLVLNPLWRAIHQGARHVAGGMKTQVLRPLGRAELMCVFTAMLVTSGISTFGLTDQLVPMVATPWNPEWDTAQRGWSDQVQPTLNRALYIAPSEGATEAEREAVLAHIRAFRQGIQPVDGDGEVMARPAEDAPLLGAGGRAEYWLAVARQIPWSAWIGPLAGWLLFIGACYAMFYTLTYVALGYWLKREKLIFPLAQLPEQLLPEDRGKHWLPYVMRTSGFWGAFFVVFAVWSWNGAINSDWLPGLSSINLGMHQDTVENIVSGGVFEGLIGGIYHRLHFFIIFTAIGLAFLLPTEISFSLWFYFLVGKIMILVLVWLGHGQTGADFPTGFFGQNNTVTAQGGGALMMFAAISLGRALLDFFHLGRGKTLGQRAMLSLPVIGLAISLAVIFGWLVWNDLPLVWALIVTAALMLITMGVMRCVAEGGVYWFQLHTSPMHLYQVFGLGHVFKPAFAMVPLVPIYSVLFFDVKTFLAPNLTNAARMNEGVNVGASRLKFHLNIIVCIVVSVLVAIAFAIFIAHLIGAQQMMGWFYSAGPPWILNHARDIMTTEPMFEWTNAMSYIFGAGWVMFSVFVRSVLFWFPHPIGYVMLVNPLMSAMWFSFFLGWIAKKLVVKYGGKLTFDSTRPIFIGLIMGELIVIFVWTILGLAYDVQPGVTLNRHP